MWYEATDKLKTYVRVVMLDFSKAFDLINHHLLIEKLKVNGIPPHVLRWMATFLLDRSQRVKIGNVYSDSGSPNGGVPQGTLSGPNCFLMYINDLRTTVPLYKYIDDSTLFEVCNDIDASLMQDSINTVTSWTEDNNMRINPDKSKEMIICFSRGENVTDTLPKIIIDDKEVERVAYAKLLGVILSEDLTWNKHVDAIVMKASKRLHMLYQLKQAGISQHDMVIVYISIVRPVLEYACPVWHTNLPIYLSDSIEMIQKRALRSIFPGESYHVILNRTGLCTLKERKDVLCKKYFRNMQMNSHKLNHLLPRNSDVGYDTWARSMYVLTTNSPNR